jgi:hypothetical protein
LFATSAAWFFFGNGLNNNISGFTYYSIYKALGIETAETDYLFQNVQAGSGVHPAFRSVDAGCLFWWVKRSLLPNTEIKKITVSALW